ncbi:MAG TPA: excinuclease ABC subunit UvrC [Crenotrichaceae bacterium]|nr:excinuclease ABC subunit UvrC [Crenotrichaceae bacterium]
MNASSRIANNAFDFDVFLRNLSRSCGVYRMLDSADKVIYVGKAKNLKNRVSSYFQSGQSTPKQRAMVAQIASIEVSVTHTEGEALLLESQLIKKYKPRYNICLRDDKSFPYIYLSTQDDYPRLAFHRGAKTKGEYFGPYPSAGAVRQSLKLLQKIFPVRQCDDSYYKHRSRPCLQYQIKRCSAPCVGLIDKQAYAEDVESTTRFLQGNGKQLINQLIRRMEAASDTQAYEAAARYRDQISTLRKVLESQYVSSGQGDLDLIVCATRLNIACVLVSFFRGGQQLGHRSFFPKLPEELSPEQVLEAFIPQYYLNNTIPSHIIVGQLPENTGLITDALSRTAKRKIQINHRVRGERRHWLQMAQTNVEHALMLKLADRQGVSERLSSLKDALGCERLLRIECFDISHTMGRQTVASCVVFNSEGPVKESYRRFNITGIEPGDDYAAMAQALQRRYKRVKHGEYEKPDVLLIDGGKGQLGIARDALEQLEIDDIMIVGVSKGPDRTAGMEKIYLLGDNGELVMEPGTPAKLLIQQIRDEAHRFAITGHRQRRAKASKQSVLEQIEGVGPKRRQRLLKQFGGLKQITVAGVDSLCQVDGINHELAQRIYNVFHGNE